MGDLLSVLYVCERCYICDIIPEQTLYIPEPYLLIIKPWFSSFLDYHYLEYRYGNVFLKTILISIDSHNGTPNILLFQWSSAFELIGIMFEPLFRDYISIILGYLGGIYDVFRMSGQIIYYSNYSLPHDNISSKETLSYCIWSNLFACVFLLRGDSLCTKLSILLQKDYGNPPGWDYCNEDCSYNHQKSDHWSDQRHLGSNIGCKWKDAFWYYSDL